MQSLGLLSPKLTSTQGPQIILEEPVLSPGLVPAGGGGKSQGTEAFSGIFPQGLSCPTLTLWSAGAGCFPPRLPVSLYRCTPGNPV